MSQPEDKTVGTQSQPLESLDQMYPDIYYQVYPKVKQSCELYDVTSNTDFYPYPTRATVERMTDHICQMVAADNTLPMNRQGYYPGYPGGYYGGYPGGYYGGYPGGYYGYGGILRPVVSILLIRELLRRRGIYYY